jgi:CelD/BcsL family acetyltransferase involved in cellulose biosynthesis
MQWMGFERPFDDAIGVAVDVTLHPGCAAEIDDVAGRADSRHAFLRRAWFAASAPSSTSTLVARRPDGRVVAALPTHDVGPKALGCRAVGGGYWPFRSFAVAQDASDDELAAFLSAPLTRHTLGPACRIGPVMTDDPTVLRLHRVAHRSGYRLLTRRVATDYKLDIAEARKAGPWPRPSTLKNNQKHHNRLARLGALEWRFVAGSDWTPALLDDLARIEANSWLATQKGADPKFIDPARAKAWRAMIADPVLAGMLSSGFLYLDGEPIAFSFGLNCGPIRYCVATSYDQRYAKNSPGYLTGYKTYIEAAARGIERLSLGAGDGGEKGSMGAEPTADIVDLLLIRGPWLAALLAPVWRRTGH